MASIILFTSFGLFLISMLIDFVRVRDYKVLVGEILLSILLISIFFLTPTTTSGGMVSFGEDDESLLSIILLLLGFVILGMIGNYFFHLKTKFHWLTFVKPMFISPIVLVPFIGLIGHEKIDASQAVSLAFLAFQNGFFWKEIYNKTQGAIKTSEI